MFTYNLYETEPNQSVEVIEKIAWNRSRSPSTINSCPICFQRNHQSLHDESTATSLSAVPCTKKDLLTETAEHCVSAVHPRHASVDVPALVRRIELIENNLRKVKEKSAATNTTRHTSNRSDRGAKPDDENRKAVKESQRKLVAKESPRVDMTEKKLDDAAVQCTLPRDAVGLIVPLLPGAQRSSESVATITEAVLARQETSGFADGSTGTDKESNIDDINRTLLAQQATTSLVDSMMRKLDHVLETTVAAVTSSRRSSSPSVRPDTVGIESSRVESIAHSCSQSSTNYVVADTNRTERLESASRQITLEALRLAVLEERWKQVSIHIEGLADEEWRYRFEVFESCRERLLMQQRHQHDDSVRIVGKPALDMKISAKETKSVASSTSNVAVVASSSIVVAPESASSTMPPETLSAALVFGEMWSVWAEAAESLLVMFVDEEATFFSESSRAASLKYSRETQRKTNAFLAAAAADAAAGIAIVERSARDAIGLQEQQSYQHTTSLIIQMIVQLETLRSSEAHASEQNAIDDSRSDDRRSPPQQHEVLPAPLLSPLHPAPAEHQSPLSPNDRHQSISDDEDYLLAERRWLAGIGRPSPLGPAPRSRGPPLPSPRASPSPSVLSAQRRRRVSKPLLLPPWNSTTSLQAPPPSRASIPRIVDKSGGSYARGLQCQKQRSASVSSVGSVTATHAARSWEKPTSSFLEQATLRYQVQYVEEHPLGTSPSRCRHCDDKFCEVSALR